MQRGRGRSSSVNTHRSYMFAHKQDDFAEAPVNARRPGSYEILYVAPANDNAKSKPSLAVKCWGSFRRLLANGFIS
jgi:hypothetical protein